MSDLVEIVKIIDSRFLWIFFGIMAFKIIKLIFLVTSGVMHRDEIMRSALQREDADHNILDN